MATRETCPPGLTIANPAQSTAWNGPEGANWAKLADRPARVDDALVADVLAAAEIGPDDRVLEIGCGTGEMTLLAARHAERGRAVGVDLSAPMIERARAAAEAVGLGNAHFDVGDAQVHPFAPAGFDVAVSHFGIMFFSNPLRAFTNVAGALRPGGRLAFVCPQAMHRCDWYVVPLAALSGRAPSPPTAPSRMFSLSDPALVEDLLTRAGMGDVTIEPVTRALRFGDDIEAATAFFLASGPVTGLLERNPDISLEQARDRLADALAPFQGDDGVRIPGQHWLVTATASPTTQ